MVRVEGKRKIRQTQVYIKTLLECKAIENGGNRQYRRCFLPAAD